MKDFADILKEWEKDNNYIDKDSNDRKDPLNRVKKRSQKDVKIDLHGMTVKEAIAHLKEEILNVRTTAEIKAFIIHGAGNHSGGESILKKNVIKWLEENRYIFNLYRSGKTNEGGHGVTIAYIKPK